MIEVIDLMDNQTETRDDIGEIITRTTRLRNVQNYKK